MHPWSSIRLAELRQEDLRASAARARLASDARRARRSGGVRSLVALLLRRPTATDQPAGVVTPLATGLQRVHDLIDAT
jgi:hypothetical protein